MGMLVADCPRCGASSITLDTCFQVPLRDAAIGHGVQLKRAEVCCVCRACQQLTVFVLRQKRGKPDAEFLFEDQGFVQYQPASTGWVDIEGFVSIKDMGAAPPPEHLPPMIRAVFEEAARCLVVGCPNAAGTMFRLAVDLATVDLLPPRAQAEGPNEKQRRDLGLRLPWLFDNGKLPRELHDLSTCIKDDGNDGAHRGTLTATDAEEMQDFAFELLQRLYTMPRRIERANERRAARRAGPAPAG